MPGMVPSRISLRLAAISTLDRSRSAAGVSDNLTSPLAADRPNVPDVVTLTTDETASGTAA